jgi:hypothetical protein
LKIDEGDSFLAMVFKAREFENLRETEEMNAPTDKEKWVRFDCFFVMASRSKNCECYCL